MRYPMPCDDCGRFMSSARVIPIYRDQTWSDGSTYRELWRVVCPRCADRRPRTEQVETIHATRGAPA